MFLSLHIPSIPNRRVSKVSCMLSGIDVGQSLTFPHGLYVIFGAREKIMTIVLNHATCTVWVRHLVSLK